MESRACQIACNQQSSPLCDGGLVHVEGKQCIYTEWSFCSGDVVPSHLTKLETVFTPIPSLADICSSPSHSLAVCSQILLFPYIPENI